MALSRVKTWTAEELTSADLNAEFDNILNNATSLISPLTGNLAFGGYRATGLAAGSVGNPTLQPTGDTNTGIYFPAADQVGVATAGTLQAYIAASASAGANLIGMWVGPTIAEASSGVHAIIAGLYVAAPTVTVGVATATNAASLYVAAATGATVTGADYSLWVDAGNVRFDGTIIAGSSNVVITDATGQVLADKLLIASQAAGDILYASSTTAWARLGKGTAGQILKQGASAPAWGVDASVGINNFRLVKSGANLTLTPINGNAVDINGTVYSYTSMPTLSGGKTASTLYYIYLYDNSGTATLEESATVPTSDTSGRYYKTGDATRRLMGMAYTDGSGNWQDTDAVRGVLSHANRPPITGLTYLTADRTVTSATFAEVNSEIRASFLAWTDTAVTVSSSGVWCTSADTHNAFASFGFDGTTAEDCVTCDTINTTTPAYGFSLSYHKSGLTQGLHYVTLLIRSEAGSIILEGNSTAGTRTSLSIKVS